MATSSTTFLHISRISVDCSKSKKSIESAEVQLRGVKTTIGRDAGAVKTLYEMKFDTPMKLSRKDTFSLWLLNKKLFRKDFEEIKFDTNEIFRVCGANQEHEYRKSYGRIAIVVTVSLVGNTSTEDAGRSASSSEESLDLHPTTDDIFKICPRFRILVIGKTGVGKSSLINHAFGVQKALASNDKPGEADIDTEFISPQNSRFVLHDSKGFEPGDEKNVKTVRDFIQRRRDMPDLKDNLHAVWLCFEIPRASGRLLETGTEEFLRLKRDGQLGNIPVVVVLTKYDMLLNRMDRTLNLEGLSDDDVKERIKEHAGAELQETCIKPLERSAGSTIPWAKVSKKEEHKDMIAHLIQITEDCVREHVATEASVMAGVAQRVDPMLNIKTSIEVGKRRYWKALASTAAFKGKTVQACLEVLHTDIVRVWNFQDPHHYLESKEFKMLVVKSVNQLDVGSIAKPNRNMAFGISTVGAIAGIVASLSPLAPIVVPIMAGVVLVKWVHDVYQLSRVMLRHFIAYIVDLTMVLQTLYLVSDEDLTRRTIKLAVAAYCSSPTIEEVHDRIKKYDGYLPLLNRVDQETLAMIEGLLNEFSIKASEIPGLRAKIPVINSQPDEPW